MGKRIRVVHNNKQRTTKQKAKKHRNQEVRIGDEKFSKRRTVRETSTPRQI